MEPTKVFIISAVTQKLEAVNYVCRQLECRGNAVTLFDMSLVDVDFNTDVEIIKYNLRELNVLQYMEDSDAAILITDEYCAHLTQVVSELFVKITSKKMKRASNVWNHNGVCCTILGGTVRKSKVAKELWEIFSESNELNLSDIFPYGSPKLYKLDYTLETPQPAVV